MPIPDRQKQRRNYVMKKATAVSKRLAGYLLLLCLLVAPIASGLLTERVIHYSSSLRRQDWSDVTESNIVFIGAIILASLTAYGLHICWKTYCSVEKRFQADSAVPYVPPVTPNSLGVEEILVRASQEPEQAQSAVLLRAAESADTPAEELLRATIGRENGE